MRIRPRPIFIAILGLLGLLFAGPAFAQLSPFDDERNAVTSGGDVVNIEAVADLEAVPPGATVTVGLRFTIEDDWHVYWRNPGDSGMAPRVKWTLPDGWEAGPLMWPLPVRFEQPGGIAGYGYGGEVMMLCEITAPAEAAPGGPVAIGAAVEYLVCDDRRCVPGKTSVSTSIELAASARSSDAVPLIERGRAALPRAEHLDTASTEVAVVGKRLGSSSLRVRWASDVTSVEAFPTAASRIDVTELAVEHRNTETKIAVTWRALAGGKAEPASELPILLTWVNGRGDRRGAMIEAPLVHDSRE